MTDDLTEALFVELARHDNRFETAVQTLHSRRHRLGWGKECGRCRADVAAVARVLIND